MRESRTKKAGETRVSERIDGDDGRCLTATCNLINSENDNLRLGGCCEAKNPDRKL